MNLCRREPPELLRPWMKLWMLIKSVQSIDLFVSEKKVVVLVHILIFAEIKLNQYKDDDKNNQWVYAQFNNLSKTQLRQSIRRLHVRFNDIIK